jgi:hypothetical protein
MEAPGLEEWHPFIHIGELKHMRMLKVALVAAFTAAASLAVGSVGDYNAVEAASHVTKGKPGKCGVGKFYSKKDKGCIAK